MLFDFFENLTGDYDVAYIMSNMIVFIGIVFLFLFPLFLPVFRNSYFIDKMNKKNKKGNKQKSSFDTQLSKLLGDTGRNDEVSECKKEIEELKKEIARLKKQKN